jgi:hypothetical protein
MDEEAKEEKQETKRAKEEARVEELMMELDAATAKRAEGVKEAAEKKTCQHGRRKTKCRDCGTGHCQHGRPKAQCRDCGTAAEPERGPSTGAGRASARTAMRPAGLGYCVLLLLQARAPEGPVRPLLGWRAWCSSGGGGGLQRPSSRAALSGAREGPTPPPTVDRRQSIAPEPVKAPLAFRGGAQLPRRSPWRWRWGGTWLWLRCSLLCFAGWLA